jgi:hypothetical protein
MFVTNRCLFQGKDPDGWIAVDAVPLDAGHVAYKAAGGYCSARADGDITLVSAVGPNETFSQDGQLASVVIGEGPRVIGVCK